MLQKHSISLRVVMKMSVEVRLQFLRANYPALNVDLAASLLKGHATIM